MDTNAAIAMLEDAARELGEARVRVAHLEQIVDGLTGILNAAGVDVGVRRRPQDTLPGRGGQREVLANMRPRDSVLYVLNRRPGLPLTPRRIYDYLLQHGMVNREMKSGIAAYDMALRRLAEEPDSGVERDEETGTYTLRRGVGSLTGMRERQNTTGPRVESDELAANRSPARARLTDTEKTERVVREREKVRKREAEAMRESEALHRRIEQRYGSARPSGASEKRSDTM